MYCLKSTYLKILTHAKTLYVSIFKRLCITFVLCVIWGKHGSTLAITGHVAKLEPTMLRIIIILLFRGSQLQSIYHTCYDMTFSLMMTYTTNPFKKCLNLDELRLDNVDLVYVSTSYCTLEPEQNFSQYIITLLVENFYIYYYIFLY